MQELVKEGRKGMQETEATLNRTEKLVEDTLQIGQQVRTTHSTAQPSKAEQSNADDSQTQHSGWSI